MHDISLIEGLLFFLLSAVVFVPLFRRCHLGAILGYLFAGVLLGPQVLDVIDNPESVLHFAEIGVVLLLFIIGLELNPDKLWAMRQQIALLGGGQLLICSIGIFLFCLLHTQWSVAMVIGLALGLSSTAFAVQLMAEKGILASANGRRGFAILLMQDLAVIPILLLVQSLAQGPVAATQPWWYGLLAVAAVLLVGRFCLNPLLNMIARYGSRETMTAMALLIVVGAAYLMYIAGLSMGMGAFAAGIMLANSHFRHQLETDIEPFKGLTLGLFFVAIGMTLNMQLLFSQPILLFSLALGLILLKTTVIAGLLHLFDVPWRSGLLLGLMLSQGGEFAFVIMAQATTLGVVSAERVELVNLMVGLSMVLTVPLVALLNKLLVKYAPRQQAEQGIAGPLSKGEPEASEVLILGFGRFAQMTGRILAANKIPFTALDNDASHIQFIKHFGSHIYFGDIMRLDMLRAAGIGRAHTVLIAIEDGGKALALTQLIKQHYPDLYIIARAYNRVNYLKLIAAGANKVVREVFSGSLEAATETLVNLGYTTGQALKTVDLFRQHDEDLLERSLAHHDDLDKVIAIGIEGRKELEELFNKDHQDLKF